MSASDSEDDSFDISRKCTAMKNDYKVDTECEPNDSITLDSLPTTSVSDSIDLETFRSAFSPINEPKRKRKTGSAAKKQAQNSPNLTDIQTSLPKRKRKSAATMEIAGNSSATIEVDLTTPPNRGRGSGCGRARGRNSSSNTNRSRRASNDFRQAMDPVISVGNTDEYPDQCDNQQLFSNKPTDDVIEIEDLDETLEDNELMSVKVEWRSARFFKFEIRKYQKLIAIFEFFSELDNVSYDKMYFSYNKESGEERRLRPDDTPDSIDYSIAKFIEGGIVTQSNLVPDNIQDKDGVKLKFQCQNVKKPFEIIIKPDEKMAIAMLQCAEHFEKPLEKLRFEFDGDIISGKSTPRELDLDESGCFDVKIMN